MKDFLNNVIELGDTVVACVPHGRNSGASLSQFVVEGFTPKFVKGSIPNYVGNDYPSLISPSKCVVIKKGNLCQPV
jgi:hypothetical protein